MSEIQKVLNLIRGGGGRKFSKSSELSEGGGGQAQLGIFPKFSRFILVTPPPRDFHCRITLNEVRVLKLLKLQNFNYLDHLNDSLCLVLNCLCLQTLLTWISLEEA